MKNILLFILAGAALALASYAVISKPKVAYVRSENLIYNYEGTREAKAQYQKKLSIWEANIDTLRQELRRFEAGLDKKQPAQMEELALRQSQLQQYAQAIGQKAEDEDSKTMEAVLSQINAFTEQYGKEQGYDLILGTTSAGNLLYAPEALDITDELLKALNKEYHGE